MTRQSFRLTLLFLLICLSIPLTATAQVVNIPDPNLRAIIEDELGKAPGAIITVADLATLTELDASNTGISDVTGLEAATNLKTLDLSGEIIADSFINSNSISDISSIAALINLTKLRLADNSISDISAIVGLTNLEFLNLRNNSISDISPLTGLTQLIHLHLGDNSISDISAIERLNNLTILWLHGNSISDISAIEELNNLTILSLGNNSISDISPLAGLTQLTRLHLGDNSISDISTIEGLNNLTWLLLYGNSISDISAIERLNNLTILFLFDNSISDISAIEGLTNLAYLDLSNNSISDISAFEGVNYLAGLELYDNSISDLSPLVANTRLSGGTRVDVRGNPLNAESINTHIPALQDRGVTVKFDNIVAQPADVNGDGVVNIFDLVLVASHFGKRGENLATDVNRDGIVDARDLVLVAGVFGEGAAAPSAHPQASEIFSAAAVRGWLTDAKALQINDPIMKRGVVVLEQLLASLTPTETQLLPNYPNPFNPETWIPYRVADDAFVTLTIYDGAGQLVRTIDAGLQPASAYESRSQAIYWDGRNQIGEKVASGVYFYHLSAGRSGLSVPHRSDLLRHTKNVNSQVGLHVLYTHRLSTTTMVNSKNK